MQVSNVFALLLMLFGFIVLTHPVDGQIGSHNVMGSYANHQPDGHNVMGSYANHQPDGHNVMGSYANHQPDGIGNYKGHGMNTSPVVFPGIDLEKFSALYKSSGKETEEETIKRMINYYVYIMLNPSRVKNPKQEINRVEKFLAEKYKININPPLVSKMINHHPTNITNGNNTASNVLQRRTRTENSPNSGADFRQEDKQGAVFRQEDKPESGGKGKSKPESSKIEFSGAQSSVILVSTENAGEIRLTPMSGEKISITLEENVTNIHIGGSTIRLMSPGGKGYNAAHRSYPGIVIQGNAPPVPISVFRQANAYGQPAPRYIPQPAILHRGYNG